MEPELEEVASTSYEGSADTQGRWSGRGRVVFNSGAIFDGGWSAGQMHGLGKITFPDGICYEGEFKNNKLTGKGVYTWPTGACYEGLVVNGLREGRGLLSFTKSASAYDGQWHNGMRHGHGVLYTNATRTSYYRGSWLNDTKHGSGVMKYENGDVYDGQWENDLRRGLGTMRWVGIRQQYSGEWENNLPHGAGLHVWFSDVEQGVPAHAQLLMHNRYYGHFKDGRRHGYGIMYYATGARYEGYWLGDQKHGPGCFVFENGEVWAGAFAQDRPLLAPGESFAPSGTGVVVQIDDLVEVEETPAMSRRAVGNLLLCYNTELRMLYDKYCKRPSYRLPAKPGRLSFSLRSACLWELLSDCRLLGPALSQAEVDVIAATARRAPERLRTFRQQERPASLEELSPEQRRFWTNIACEHAPGGEHAPAADLTFRAFCEALVRIASARFHHVPCLERRLHQALTQHLLHIVNKAKATPPVPPAPLPVLPPNISVEAAGAVLIAVRERMAALFLEAAGAPPPPSKAELAAAAAAPEARGAAAVLAGGVVNPVYGVTATAHALATALVARGGAEGALMAPLTMQQALLQLLWNYVYRNAYGPVQRIILDNSSEEGIRSFRSVVLAPEDEQELLALMDMPLTFADWEDGVLRVVRDWTDPEGGLLERLQAVVGGSVAGQEGGGEGPGLQVQVGSSGLEGMSGEWDVEGGEMGEVGTAGRRSREGSGLFQDGVVKDG